MNTYTFCDACRPRFTDVLLCPLHEAAGDLLLALEALTDMESDPAFTEAIRSRAWVGKAFTRARAALAKAKRESK